MFGERRSHPRHTINRNAKFQTQSGSLPRECIITDISQGGARLFVTGAEPPDQFTLLISGDKLVREECLVAWRLGGEVGVKFVTQKKYESRTELINRLRIEERSR